MSSLVGARWINPNDNLWFTEPSTSKVGHVSTAGLVFPEIALSAGSFPRAITAAPDGYLDVGALATGKIDQITASGAVFDIDMVDNDDTEPKDREAEPVPPGISPRHHARLRAGYRAYVRDLPQLLKEQHEGHLVAYWGNVKIGIAPTNNQLHEALTGNPKYTTHNNLLVKRVTVLDAEEFGLQI